MSLKTVTSYQSIEPCLHQFLQLKSTGEIETALHNLEAELLIHHVKFPILEKVAEFLHANTTSEEKAFILDWLGDKKHMSGYPIIGKMLQIDLANDFISSFNAASEQIIKANEGLSCDIISERVFGEGLLMNFDLAYSLFQSMENHNDQWIQRSIGIASHYAIKKKLPKESVEKLLLMLIRNGHKTQLHIKTGISLPAKTIAKFHPDLVEKHQHTIDSSPELSKWFLRKLKIGLEMAKEKNESATSPNDSQSA
jgi:hypothetical protein